MAVIYLFNPQLTCLGAFDAADLVHCEATYEARAEFKTDMRLTSGYCFGFHCIDGKFRIFEIDEVDYRDETGDLYITGTDLAVRELTDIVVTDVRCVAMTAPVALDHLLDATGSSWTVGTTITTDSLTSRHYYKRLWTAIVDLMDRYNVRMVPSFVIDSSCTITARVIDVVSAEPVYRGRLFESGDDASNVKVTVSGNPKTALYGRGKGVETGETESGDATYGPRLTFKDVVWSTLNGDPVDKPLNQEWVGDPEALVAFGRNGEHRFDVVTFDQITNPEELLQRTWEYLQTVCWPAVSATATVYDLEMADGYSYAAVRVNDEIVIRPKLFPADVTARITQIYRDYINPANTRLEISTTGVQTSASSLYAETTKQIEAAQEFEAQALTRDSVIDTMVTKIMSSGTDMYTDPDSGALCFVADDGTSAMMLTGGGMMIADEKIGGVWQWKTAATGDGIVADMITTGTLQASLIKIFGSDHFYWDANNIYIKEGSSYAMHAYGVTLTKTGGVFETVYVQPMNISGSSNVNLWTNYGGPPERSTVTFECTSTTGQFYIFVGDTSGGTYVEHQVIMGPSALKQTLTLSGSSINAFVNPLSQTITGLKVYVHIEDMTDVGTTWDLGDLTIPATESAWSAALKSGCTLGTYTISVTSVSADTDIKLSTVDLSTTEETTVGWVTQGGYTNSFDCQAPFDLMFGRDAPSLRQIRIGCYDGVHWGIGFTQDNGATWETAIDFNGVCAVTTTGDYIKIKNANLEARAGAAVSIMSGGSFHCYAGSAVSFVTDDFYVKNRAGRNLLSIGSIEGKEGQIILGEEGFPVNFAGGFILPVVNGGTGYNFGQVHRITNTPNAGLGADGDLAIRYASSSGAYDQFIPTIIAPQSQAASHVIHGGLLRFWNNQNSINSGIPAGYWAAGNDNGYAYGIYGEFTSPATNIDGAVTLEVTGYHYYLNAANLTCYIVNQGGTVIATAAMTLAYRANGVASCVFNSVQLTASTTYALMICDTSDVLGNTSKSYISQGTINFPAYAGNAKTGLYIKSAGVWVTAFETT